MLASILHQPSYVSLETALYLHGLMPDIPALINNVTTTFPDYQSTVRGTYVYHRLAKKYYYGFEVVQTEEGMLTYHLVVPEKALLDWMYLRKIDRLEST